MAGIIINIEIKARANKQDKIRKILKSKNAIFKGIDHQIDTYFKVNSGRLKLRQGNIENHLIWYAREDKKGPKQSKTILFETKPNSLLKDILTKALGVLVVVDKKREIYFIDNVKFHIDKVESLGTFIEIEVQGNENNKDELLKQCQYFIDLFGISQEDLINVSYSDLLMDKIFNDNSLKN